VQDVSKTKPWMKLKKGSAFLSDSLKKNQNRKPIKRKATLVHTTNKQHTKSH
jgi:hypothetical protein